MCYDDGIDDDDMAQLLDDLSHNSELTSSKGAEDKQTSGNNVDQSPSSALEKVDSPTASIDDLDDKDAQSDIDMDELALLEGLGDTDLNGSTSIHSNDEGLNGVDDAERGSVIASEEIPNVAVHGNETASESLKVDDLAALAKVESSKCRPRSKQQGLLDTKESEGVDDMPEIEDKKPEHIFKEDFERIRVNHERKVKKCEAEIRLVKDKLAGYHADFIEQCKNYGQPLLREGVSEADKAAPVEKPIVRYTAPTSNNLSFSKSSRRSAMTRDEEERAAKERAELQAETRNKRVETELYTGLSITQRRISVEWLQKNLNNRQVKRITGLSRYFAGTRHATEDFVVMGVLEQMRTTKDGNKEFWSLTDLKGESQSFLLKIEVAKELKADEFKRGSLVAILNPAVMKKSGDFKSQLVVVNEKDQIINMGDCPDFAICKSKKKDGKKCTMAVNISRSAYCKSHLTTGLKENSAKRALTNAQQTNTRLVNVNTVTKTMKSLTNGVPQQSGAEKLSAVVQASENASLSYIKPRQTTSVSASKGIDLNSSAVNKLRGASQFQKVGVVRNTPTYDPSRDRGDKRAETASKKLQKGGFMQCPVSEKSGRDFLIEAERKKAGYCAHYLLAQNIRTMLAKRTALIKSKIKAFDPNQCPPVDEDVLAANLRRMDEKEAEAKSLNKRKKDSADEAKPRKKILRRGLEGESKPAEKPKFGQLARGKLDELIKKEAINQKLHELEEKELENERDEILIRKEQIYDVMASTKENTRTCQYCEDCDIYFYTKEALCLQKGHTFKVKKDCVVRYFKCNGCKKKIQTINRKIPDRCKCTSLTRMGMIDEKKVKPGEEFLARGEEHGIVLGSKPVPAGVNT
ncbi:hypothetical protein SARC_01894 [Sphaeroforma arctica JP610]|uniref:Protein MCM10 homolog n=1 Tax=Sphaeroforma arctica JP610 TaxID=667725 RepID=A0A0L0GCF5_9EUKA|nr:hypothetical protein SARC_01894 [Sphaeroforma arctica JP610]KNC85948.1 hypothetical protein SARC_01894 [Sphaeroforma arctica JP610]|eukprot:XP_014159850.1 hypothetical protein SARC_01894 [Sphaeroforma arctica JP610]